MHFSTFIFAAVASMASFAAATPPACLLAAVMEQPNPADLKALCGTLEPQLASNITASCSGSNLAAAIDAYSSTCLAQGVTISIATTTSGSSAATGTSSAARTTGASGIVASATGSAATASSTAKSAASTVSMQSTGLFLSAVVGFGLIGQYLL